MTWNYRIIEHDTHPDEKCFCVHEVYYDVHGKVQSWTMRAAGILGDTFEELPEILNMVAKAFTLPILKLSELDKIVPE